MTINQDYLKMLDHLGPTVTVAEFIAQSSKPDLIALRHDVDHDLDLALAMAHLEHAAGRRATYFILHTAPYIHDEEFLEKCLKIQDYGHEIGLHLNALSPWCDGETDDPIGDLSAWLDSLRDAGVEIVGSAAHGDQACYEHGFINYWIWRELRGDDPAVRENGLTAEGVRRGSDDDRSVSYPSSDAVIRADGATFPLWSVSMESLGLSYEACRAPFDRYWSDSGGSWKRSPNPMEHELSRGRHQVLVHPIWWSKSLYSYTHIMQLEASPVSGRFIRIANRGLPCPVVSISKGMKGTLRGEHVSPKNSHVMLHACATWNELKQEKALVADADWCRGCFTYDLNGPVGPVRLFLLGYDPESGQQVMKYPLGTLNQGRCTLEVDVPTSAGSLAYALAVHFGQQPQTCSLQIKESTLELCQRFGPAGNRLSPQAT
jgi:hypothetical protein